jgi:hypothetical protein
MTALKANQRQDLLPSKQIDLLSNEKIFMVARGVHSYGIEANYSHGAHHLQIPKKEESSPKHRKKIKVE